MRQRHTILLVILVFGASACNGDDPAVDADTDADADIDAERDAEQDAEHDADVDAEPPRPCERDEECDNWRFCDGQETCVDGFCAAGEPPDCDDGDDCTDDTCSNARMGCVHHLIVIDEDGDGYGSHVCYGPDCDDGDAAVNPGAREVCNGIDDNCNGLIDEPGPVLVTSESPWPSHPVILEGEGGYGLFWSDERELDREIYFALYDMDGETKLTERRVTTSRGASNYPTAVWTGSEYVVVWADDRTGVFSLFFQRLSAEGELVGDQVRISGTTGVALYPSLLWTGSVLWLVWAEQLGEAHSLLLARLSLEGAIIGEISEVTPTQMSWTEADIVWTGEELGVLWSDRRAELGEIYFARFNALGARLGEELELSSGAFLSSPPTMAWTGSEYVALWADQRSDDYDVYMARLSAAGELRFGPQVVIDSESWSQGPEVAWSGDELHLVFRDDRDGADEIYWTRMNLDGEPLADTIAISHAQGWTSDPEIAWIDGRLAVTWAELGDGYGLYFATSCPAE